MTTPAPSAENAVRLASERARVPGHGPVWLALRDHHELVARARIVDANAGGSLPLRGLTFGVKDNIDVAGMPTTAGCPAYAYVPAASAPVVDALERAGAVCIGKTHLDQFATGLVGTRSPLGALKNPFDSAYVSGGSSSGSAVAVALGHVDFALGTDTAGSGRIPAAFNNLVGIKPTRGLLSTRGVVPACRSLDCVSIFAREIDVAWLALRAAAVYDPLDPFARAIEPRAPARHAPKLAIPDVLEFDGDRAAAAHFEQVVAQWRALGGDVATFAFAPFREAAALLYDGPWIAERDAAVGAFIAEHPDAVDPAVRAIVADAARYSATDAFRASYRLRELVQEASAVLGRVDALLVPTAPTHPRLADIAREPIAANARLGRYVNFVNLLDLATVAVPAGRRADGLPAGFCLVGPAGSDHALAMRARANLERHPNLLGTSDRVARIPATLDPLAPGPDAVLLAVAGAHMRGMPLNVELTREGARFVATRHTAPHYQMHLVRGGVPKPGLTRVENGFAIALELWELTRASFGHFVASVPHPMTIGTIELDDGEWVKGFLCEPIAVSDAPDITSFGGWRAYLAANDAELHSAP
jgi:allophanate hydrolase